MLRNKLYIYSEEKIEVPIDLNYGRFMLRKFMEHKDSVALTDSTTDKSLTYAEMAQMTVDVALSLVSIGLKKGDIVAVCSEETLFYYPTALGIMCAGGVFSDIHCSGSASIKHNANLLKPKTIFLSEHTYKTYKDVLLSIGTITKFIVYTEKMLDGAVTFKDFLTEHGRVEDFIPVQVNGAVDACLIYFSSGTTGMPKGVIKNHVSTFNETLAIAETSYYKGKIILTPCDFCQISLFCLYTGNHIIFISDERENVNEVLRVIQKYKVQVVMQFPSIIFDLAHSDNLDNYDVSSMECIWTGSSNLRSSVEDLVKIRFPHLKMVAKTYGTSETGVACKEDHLAIHKPGSVGRPYACNIKIVDPNTGKALGHNKHGEIRIQSAGMATGYTPGSKVILPIDHEGFYMTGDIGFYDEDHYIYLVDRIKDIIFYQGLKISPAQVESILIQHPAVLDVGVVGLPDERCDELPIAFVIPRCRDNVTEREMELFVNEQLPAATPLAGGVRFVTSLPRGNRGKLDRKALKQMATK